MGRASGLMLTAPSFISNSSLGTGWGLFRHYWVLIKLLLTIPATLLLVVHTGPASFLADVVAKTNLSGGDLGRLRPELPA